MGSSGMIKRYIWF